MKKLLSDMTAAQFIDYQNALGVSGDRMGALLCKSPSTISQYRAGARRVPVDVHNRITELMEARMRELQLLHMDLVNDHDAIVGAAVVFHNTKEKKPRPPAFYNYAGNPAKYDREARLTLGAYRLTQPRYAMLKQGLGALARTLIERAKAHPESRTIIKALADLKPLLEHVNGLERATPPFTLAPTQVEWRLISAGIRAITGADAPSAYAFYQHWRRHKGTGWPKYRRTAIPAEVRQSVTTAADTG